jgi:hypothetical protein
VREHGTGSVELDTIPPSLVRKSIEEHMNPERLRVLKLAEEQERDLLGGVWVDMA